MTTTAIECLAKDRYLAVAYLDDGTRVPAYGASPEEAEEAARAHAEEMEGDDVADRSWEYAEAEA